MNQSHDPKNFDLESDLRASQWIVEKVKLDETFAQHLYAALCNNEFIKNNIWSLLSDRRWSCSWRYAGGIIADIRNQGSYMDWYCSGSEGLVTDEIKEELFKLGWIVIPQEPEVY